MVRDGGDLQGNIVLDHTAPTWYTKKKNWKRSKESNLMKIIIVVDLTETEGKCLAENSIERVFNTSIRMAEACRDGKRSRSVIEDAGLNVEDLQDSKPIVTALWNSARDAWFRRSEEKENGELHLVEGLSG